MTRNKKILITVLIILIPVLYFALGPIIYGFVTAPKFNGITYTKTRYDRQTTCIVTCNYSAKYNYSAYGSQKELITSISKTLSDKGYSLRTRDAGKAYDIGCYGRIGDRYFYVKGNNGTNDYTKIIGVTFYATEKASDKPSSAVGCDRSPRDYRIEITGLGNWLSLG